MDPYLAISIAFFGTGTVCIAITGIFYIYEKKFRKEHPEEVSSSISNLMTEEYNLKN